MRVAILTVSDGVASGHREDLSGPKLAALAEAQGWTVAQRGLVPDEAARIQETLSGWTDSDQVDLILTTGGTGFAPRDVTPEATLAVLDRQAPGLAEAMRLKGMQLTPHAMLSRAVAGIRGRAVIVNLPGSPKGAIDGLQAILTALPHAVRLLQDDPGAAHEHAPPRPQQTA